MTGISMGAARAMADKFPWDRYRTVIDVGAAEGCVPVRLACAIRISPAAGSTCPPCVPASSSTSRQLAWPSACVPRG
jgi:hypothetical protein